MNDDLKFAEEAKKNAERISDALRELGSIEVVSSEIFFQYRDKSKRILELFKTLKPLLGADRTVLWDRFQQISNENRIKHEERKKSRENASTRKKELVLTTINDASGYTEGDSNALKKAEDILRIAHEQMKPGWRDGFGTLEPLFHLSDGKMMKEDLEYCRQKWDEVKQKIQQRRNDIYYYNYMTIKDDLHWIADLAVTGDPYEALKQIKFTKQKVFSHLMIRENKDALLKSLNEYWQKAVQRIEERKAEKERKQKEWELRKAERDRKQREWELRKVEQERKRKEYEEKKIYYERKKQEWEERKREKERKQREYEEIKLERARERERKREEYEERKRNRGSRKSGGGGCYITTATCLTLGKKDDCYELNTIRDFRDNWLSKQDEGDNVIYEYYKIAPQIVEKINQEKNKNKIYKDIWNDHLKYFFESIIIGNNKKAKIIYLKMVKELELKYLEF